MMRIRGSSSTLSSERWQVLEPLFDRALDLPEEERAVFIERVVSNDNQLRDDLQQLLRAERDSAGLLAHPTTEFLAAALAESPEGNACSGTSRRDIG
jgi:hypothetical protein